MVLANEVRGSLLASIRGLPHVPLCHRRIEPIMRTISFSGGEALQMKLQEIMQKVKNTPAIKIGFIEGATYPDGTPVPMVAALNEYGHSVASAEGDYFQMPRPFFRNMIAEKSPNWGKSLAAIAKANDYDMQKSMALMGEGIGSQLQQSIIQFNSVPLADSTVAKKGFDKQLIDTAVMINSVGYQVDDGDKVTLPPAASGGKQK